MRAMVLQRPHESLIAESRADPEPGAGQVVIRVRACGLCRTDLHIVDGELDRPSLPLVLGHQIVGIVERVGDGVTGVRPGARVGVPWLAWACGECRYCRSGRENLCERARFTGYDVDGGYAELAVADARFCVPIPVPFADVDAAPLLCAGPIGYRCLQMAGDAERLGIVGFGSAAQILTQVARHQGRRVFAFTRPGDDRRQAFAWDVGAEWAGGTDARPPEPLDAAILFAPAGDLVPAALALVVPGGTVVCGEIHMSDVPSMPYSLLWGERVLRTVANLTRRDASEFLGVAAEILVRTAVESVRLDDANDALDRIRRGDVRGSLAISMEA